MLLLASFLALAATAATVAAGKPNIVFVITDDQDMNMGYVSQVSIRRDQWCSHRDLMVA